LTRLFRIIDNRGSNLSCQNSQVAKIFVVLANKMQKTEAIASGSYVTKQASLMVNIQFILAINQLDAQNLVL